MNCKLLSVVLLAACVILGNMARIAKADTIVCPTAASDDDVDLAGLAAAPHSINGSGLNDASLVANGAAIPSTWSTASILLDDGSNWTNSSIFGGGGTTAAQLAAFTLTYTLAGPTNLTGGHFWNYQGLNGPDGRSLVSADIWVSADNINYTMAGTLTPGYTNAGKNVGDLDSGVDFSLAANNVSYVQLRNMSNGDKSDIIAFNEIRFVGNPVPEPSSIYLLGSGLLGLLAYAWRKLR